MSAPAYGRLHVPEPPSSLLRLHFHDGSTLKVADHEPKIPVLDQSDLDTQGIMVSQIVPGAKNVTALGSCVANASTAGLSTVLPTGALASLGINADPVADEKFAIGLYHDLTMLTGDPASEFPPQDCGSSGLYSCQYLEAKGIITGHKIAHGAQNILSLMQGNGLIVGQPFLNAWEDPSGPDYFIDGDGSLGQLAADIQGGVAGGHETYWSAIEHLALDALGRVDPYNTIIRFRNSWSASWADSGSAYAHLSTYMALGSYCDFRQFEFAA